MKVPKLLRIQAISNVISAREKFPSHSKIKSIGKYEIFKPLGFQPRIVSLTIHNGKKKKRNSIYRLTDHKHRRQKPLICRGS